jgi:hypothetical protein
MPRLIPMAMAMATISASVPLQAASDVPWASSHPRSIKRPVELHYNADGTIRAIDPYKE